jgi:hypothetical protein
MEAAGQIVIPRNYHPNVCFTPETSRSPDMMVTGCK